MEQNRKKRAITQMGWTFAGSLLFAAGVNLIIMPMKLYNGGFMGVAQLIRTFVVSVLHVDAGQIDLAGMIFYILNVPLFYLAWKGIGKSFCVRTVIAATMESVLLTVIPIPKTPIITDMLTACIIGGLISGVGTGLILRGGSSGGGQDIIGILCAKKYPGFSVGKIGIIMNIGVYGVCMMLFDMEVVIYSLIYATVVSLAIDKIHIQNINMSVMIFTKKLGVAKAIMEETGRGVTNWEGTGAYTKENTEILYVVISKYEVNQIKRIVQGIDPKAFMIFTEGTAVTGNFEKRL
mgnify:CR=1 FL=1